MSIKEHVQFATQLADPKPGEKFLSIRRNPGEGIEDFKARALREIGTDRPIAFRLKGGAIAFRLDPDRAEP